MTAEHLPDTVLNLAQQNVTAGNPAAEIVHS